MRWTVGPDDVGARLDAWLAGRLDGVSRSQVGRALDEGRVTLDGERPPKAGVKLREGSVVAYSHAEPVALEAEAQDIPLPVVHEDRWLAVVDKPAGMVVHPAPGHPDGTLVNALLHHLGGLSGVGGATRPGIVHRLDRDTSGLLVVAKDDATHRALSDLFKRRNVERRYLAVVLGGRIDDAGTIETLHGRHPTDRKRFSGRVRRGRRAVTHWETLARGEALALLVLRLETGRTHQIRVHLTERGHPVVADPLYGRKLPRGGGGRTAVELAAARRMPRLALHAATLGFVHPQTGEALRFVAEPPDDLATLIERAFGADVLEDVRRSIRE
ncbi:MAG: RluA family pseudouridine synthase [Myxococcota bacterium]